LVKSFSHQGGLLQNDIFFLVSGNKLNVSHWQAEGAIWRCNGLGREGVRNSLLRAINPLLEDTVLKQEVYYWYCIHRLLCRDETLLSSSRLFDTL